MIRSRRPRPTTSSDPAGPSGGHSRRAGGLPHRRQRRHAGSAAGARGRRAGGVVQRARALIDGRGRHGQVLGIAAGSSCRGWPWHVQRRPHRAQHARSCMRAGVCLCRPLRSCMCSLVSTTNECLNCLHMVDAGDTETVRCALTRDAMQRSSPHTETDSTMTQGTCNPLPVFIVVTAQLPAAWALP